MNNETKKGKMVPELRFPGFDGEWEVKKVKDICNINTGKSNSQDQVDNGQYPFYIRSAIPVRSNRYLYDCEAVITIGDGQIGKVFHYVNGKFDLHQRCYMMSSFKDVNPRFFYYFFSENFYERAMRLSAKATVDSVRLEMISDMLISLPPSLPEQQKIAECLSSVDDLIRAEADQLQALKDHKKGLMQQLFPQEGETMPKLRFPGFEGKWEEKKLGEVAPVIFDGTHQTPHYTNKGVPFYSIENIVSDKPCKFIAESEHKSNTSKNKTEKGDILITRIGTIGFSKIVDWDGEFSTYVSLATVKKSQLINTLYLHGYLQSDNYQTEIRRKSLLNAIPCKINMEDLKNTIILHPSSPSEQQKIASCLSSLDDLIAAQQEKVEALKEHKKGLMQKLFPTIN